MERKRKVTLAYGWPARKIGTRLEFQSPRIGPNFLFANFALTFRRFLAFPRMSEYYIAIDHSFYSEGHREYYKKNRFLLVHCLSWNQIIWPKIYLVPKGLVLNWIALNWHWVDCQSIRPQIYFRQEIDQFLFANVSLKLSKFLGQFSPNFLLAPIPS